MSSLSYDGQLRPPVSRERFATHDGGAVHQAPRIQGVMMSPVQQCRVVPDDHIALLPRMPVAISGLRAPGEQLIEQRSPRVQVHADDMIGRRADDQGSAATRLLPHQGLFTGRPSLSQRCRSRTEGLLKNLRLAVAALWTTRRFSSADFLDAGRSS